MPSVGSTGIGGAALDVDIPSFLDAIRFVVLNLL